MHPRLLFYGFVFREKGLIPEKKRLKKDFGPVSLWNSIIAAPIETDPCTDGAVKC